ncbi:MAG TPA: sigma-70 family RNA polymerase sigma factor [Pirellulales bacterium]|nr:sigma-70 family RNA polymerase sigma factor [Pirellulales bacterium]
MSNHSASDGLGGMAANPAGREGAGGFDAARLIEEHQTGVWRYLRVLGCDAAEAEDLTQETFLAVLQKPFQDYQRAATAAYLRQVARNLLMSSRRRATRGAVVVKSAAEMGLGDLDAAAMDAAEAAWLRWSGDDDGAERLAALRRCLQTLTERARQALELRFGEQASRADIAAALGMSEDGAKNVLQRAKQHLRACIEQEISSETARETSPGEPEAGQRNGAVSKGVRSKETLR